MFCPRTREDIFVRVSDSSFDLALVLRTRNVVFSGLGGSRKFIYS